MAVIVDIESTCWGERVPYNSEIIEIGAVKDTGEEFQAFIKPIKSKKISEFCTKLTSIVQKDVDNAESFGEVIKKFMQFVGDDTVYSWGNYDKQMIQRQCLEMLGLQWDFKHVNLKNVYAKLYKAKECGMARALEKEQIKLEGTHHRGIDDARNIQKIYKKIEAKIPDILRLDVERLAKKLKGFKVEKYEGEKVK